MPRKASGEPKVKRIDVNFLDFYTLKTLFCAILTKQRF